MEVQPFLAAVHLCANQDHAVGGDLASASRHRPPHGEVPELNGKEPRVAAVPQGCSRESRPRNQVALAWPELRCSEAGTVPLTFEETLDLTPVARSHARQLCTRVGQGLLARLLRALIALFLEFCLDGVGALLRFRGSSLPSSRHVHDELRRNVLWDSPRFKVADLFDKISGEGRVTAKCLFRRFCPSRPSAKPDEPGHLGVILLCAARQLVVADVEKLG